MGRQFLSASSQYYQATSPPPDRTATFSLGAWIYLLALPPNTTFRRIAEKGQTGGATGLNWRLEYRENFGRNLDFMWHNGGIIERYVSVTLGLLRWYHVLVTCDWTVSPTVTRISLNGVPQTVSSFGSTTLAPAISGTQVARVGRSVYEAQNWNDRIAEVFTSPVVLNTAHATALWQGQTPDRLGVPLDAYWPLRGIGSVEADLSGNGRHLVPSASAPSPTQHPYPVPAPPLGRPGRFWIGDVPPAAVQDTPELAGRPFGRWGSRHTQQALAF